MVRFTTISLLILLLMSKTFFSFFWQTYFYINQAAIIEMECENKDRPEMNCNGNCFLSKQLEKADQELAQKKSERSKSLDNLKKAENSLYMPTPVFGVSTLLIVTNQDSDLSMYQDPYDFDFCSKILQPPRS